MNVRKMYVIPSEFYDSLIQKNRIVEDPIITAQIRIEDEKGKVLKQKNAEKTVIKLANIAHRQVTLEDQRKKKIAEPIPVTIIPTFSEPKKRGRPPNVPPKSYFGFENPAGEGLLKRFYDFEPKGKRKKEILQKLKKFQNK